MLTRCPKCQTIYHIRVEQLEMADGQAHCCRCDQVFNAQENLQEQPCSDLAATEELESPELPFSDIDQDSDLAYIADVYRLELKNIEASGPATTETEGEPSFSEVGDTLSTPPEGTAPPSSEESKPEPPPGTAEQRPDAQHPDTTTLSVEDLLSSPKKRRSLIATLFWFMGSLILLILTMAQLAWFQREMLVQYPQGRLLLEKFCAYAECSVPQLRDTSRIHIVSRQVRSHPNKKGVLLVQLVMVNRAPFPQPYPLMELSLSTVTKQAAARRSFKPEEYLHTAKDSVSLMPSGVPQHVEMELVDPGKEMTGFEFDFL